MSSIVSVDPFRCRVWAMHGRLEEHVNENNCATEIESFKRHGQLTPILVRPARDDPEYDVELICGARRLFVARYIKVNLLAEVRELSDREAIIAMDVENRQRKDLSPYERGVSYARFIRGGYFASQEELALALNTSPSQVSRLLKLARLPSAIVGAFNTAVDIHESWGLNLAETLEDPQYREALMRAAREIRTRVPRPAAREVYRRLLMSAARGYKPKGRSRDRVVKGKDGAPLFRIRQQRDSIALLLPTGRISGKALDAIERAVLHILQAPPAQEHLPAALEIRRRWNHPVVPAVGLPDDLEQRTQLLAPLA